jgi:hypothetical protein
MVEIAAISEAPRKYGADAKRHQIHLRIDIPGLKNPIYAGSWIDADWHPTLPPLERLKLWADAGGGKGVDYD